MSTDTPPNRPLLDGTATERLIAELAARIDASAGTDLPLVLIGIQRRGDSIARRIAGHLEERRGRVPTGSLDITLYRDDFAQVGSLPLVGTTSVPEEVDGAHVVIVDDVLYTGRTIRAAINELSDFGRAARIELCVLVDRGGRQLPIQPDYVGERVEVADGEQISVRVADLDGSWGVDVVEVAAGEGSAP